MARPTKYTEEIAEEILNRIRNGESCTSVMASPSMPNKSTLFYWLDKDEAFSDRYARALEYRTHQKAEQRHDLLEEAFIEGVPANFDSCPAVWGNLVKERLRAIEWDAERLAAKKYKPRQEVEHTVNTGDVSDALSILKD